MYLNDALPITDIWQCQYVRSIHSLPICTIWWLFAWLSTILFSLFLTMNKFCMCCLGVSVYVCVCYLFILVAINNIEINYRLKLSVINHFIFIIIGLVAIRLHFSLPLLILLFGIFNMLLCKYYMIHFDASVLYHEAHTFNIRSEKTVIHIQNVSSPAAMIQRKKNKVIINH